MMKNRIFKGLAIVFTVVMGLLGGLSCSDPDITMPQRDNLLDEENPDSVEGLFELQVIFDNTGVSLQWTAVELPGLAGYQVLRKTGTEGEFELQIQTENLYWFDGDVSEETEYTYRVVAVNADGDASGALGEDSVDVPTLPVFQINNGDEYTNSEEVDLTLNADDITSVWVCNWTGADRDSLDGQWWVSKDKVDPLLSWELAESDVDGGKTIRIWIQYLNNATRTASCSIVLDKTPPAPGTLSTPEHGAQDVPVPTSFVWTAASDNGSGVAGYSLFLDTETNPETEVFTGNELNWTSGLLDPETTYYWRVSAFDSVGNTSARYQDDVQSFQTAPESNVPPVLDEIGTRNVNELELLSFTVTANDPDPGQTLVFSIDQAAIDLGMNISEAGHFTWTPSEVQGPDSYSVEFSVTDGLDSDSENVTINVSETNEPPVLDEIGTRHTLELELLSFTVTAADTDVPEQTLIFSIDQASIDQGMSISEAGLFTWTPSEEQGPDSYSVEFSVTDGLASDSEIVTINVSESNEPPVLDEIGTRNVNELELLSFTATADDPDPGQTLVYSIDQAAIDLGMTISEAGHFTWTPSEVQGPDSYSVEFSVTDGLDSDSENVTINVSETNEPPVLDEIGTRHTLELELLSFTVTAADTDVPEQTLIFSIDQASIDQGMSISEAGLFTWTPSEEQGPDSYSVEFSVTDGLVSDSENVTINVSETNEPPVLDAIGTRHTLEMEPLSFTVTATDIDVPEQTLIFSIDQASIDQGMSISETGHFTWTPSEEQGPDSYSVEFSVTDGLTSGSENVTINVSESNAPPVLDSVGTQYVNETEFMSLVITALDTDLPEQTLSFSIDQDSIDLGMNISATGYFTWTPTEAHGPGAYEVFVTVSDGSMSDEGSFTIIVYGLDYDGEFVSIPPTTISMPATFTMGGTVNSNEAPPHQVTLTGRINMASTEVTNAQYVAVLQWAFDQEPPLITVNSSRVVDAIEGSAESDLLALDEERCQISFSGGVFSTPRPNHPVIHVTWCGSAAYCDWLNLQAGLPLAYDHSTWSCNSGSPYTETGYRLPTEAEWEFACRAGTATHFNTGDCLDSETQANYRGDYPFEGCDPGDFVGDTTNVRSYPTNQWLLYDMHGNAFEWCNDRWGNYSGDEQDPVGGTGSTRLMRGGSYNNSATNCRSAYRNADNPGAPSYLYGFRFVRSVD